MLTSLMYSLILGFLCYNCPLRIRPNSLLAWERSCVLIPCEISEMLQFAKVNATGVVWFFEPFWNSSFYDYSGSLLYDSDKTLEENAVAASADFQGRVRFVGNLGSRDCSLVISQLRTMDSGSYGARVVASVGTDPWRHKWFQSAMLNITELPPKPKIEIVSTKIQGNIIMTVTCSVFYHCPDEPVTLIFNGRENQHLSSQKLTRGNGTIQIMATVELTWEDAGKKMTVFQGFTGLFFSFLVVAPEEVNVHQYPEGLIYEGDLVNLTCEVGIANPRRLTYAWYKDGQQLQLDSPSETLTIPWATRSISGNYWCEASNAVGTSQSSKHMLNVTCE
uniref:B-cell receptor CD22 n=1 Tax=Salvator merianae TaxID=96440 RepID=A0A8D0CGJ5_SALMN